MKGPYTNVNIHNPNSHITDDTIMTLASADFLLDTEKKKYASIEDACAYQNFVSEERSKAMRGEHAKEPSSEGFIGQPYHPEYPDNDTVGGGFWE